MLSFFTDPYEDELLYSVIARYHYYSGNISYRDTLEQVFGDRNVIPSIQVPSRLDYLSQQLPNGKYTFKKLLYDHTILPYYLPFMNEEKKKQVIENTKTDGGQKLHLMIGMTAGGICRKRELYYCPVCAKEDFEEHDEAYFHRAHQLEGVFVCHKHKCLLKAYPVKLNQISRIAFIRFDKEIVEFSIEYVKNKGVKAAYEMVACQAERLLNMISLETSKKSIHDNIKIYLSKKGFITEKGKVRQRYLCEEFYKFYGRDILKKFESDFDIENDHSWLRTITRKMRKDIHPARFILLTNFLCGDISNLFRKVETLPRKETINRGYRFDDRWCDKLSSLISRGGYSLRGFAKEMSCDPKTVIKYAEILGLKDKINSNMKVYVPKGKPEISLEEDVKAIIDYIKKNPKCTRKDIRDKCSKHYTKLYRHDKQKLWKLLPSHLDKVLIEPVQKTDWVQRDKELLDKAKQVSEGLYSSTPDRRISKTFIINKMDVPSLERWLPKLTLTKQYIESNAESVEQYQIRRVDRIYKEMLEENCEFKPWEVMRKTGLRGDVSEKVKKRIEYRFIH